MIVKDFLLSLDREKLCEIYYQIYEANNVISQAEAKKGGYDLKERIYRCVNHCLDQFTEIEPITTSDERIMIVKYYDFDINDNLETEETSTLDPHILNIPETKNRGRLSHITKMDEAINGLVWQSYSTMMIPWERLLGYEICHMDGDEYEAAASLVFEITYFGWDKEDYDERTQEIKEDLDERQREVEEGTAQLIEYDEEKFCEEFDIPVPTPEQKAKEREMIFSIAVKNYNIQVDIYNKLLDEGIIH